MLNFSLRRYDTQARVSVGVSIASGVALLGMALLVFRHVDMTQFVISYGPTRKMLILIAGAVTMLLAAIGFGMGLNSAGQRRNDKPTLSWIGFFIGAGVLCLAIVLLVLFRLRGEAAMT